MAIPKEDISREMLDKILNGSPEQFQELANYSAEFVRDKIKEADSPFLLSRIMGLRGPAKEVPVELVDDSEGNDCPSCGVFYRHYEAGTYEVMNPMCPHCGEPTEAC